MKPLYVVISKIFGVYTIQTLNVSIALVFESLPIERGGLLNGEAICFGFVEGFLNKGSMPCDFLRDTA